MLKLKNAVQRNADPITAICHSFCKQVAALSAYIETKDNEVRKNVQKVVEAQNAIDAARAEIERAETIKNNIEGIIGKIE